MNCDSLYNICNLILSFMKYIIIKITDKRMQNIRSSAPSI